MGEISEALSQSIAMYSRWKVKRCCMVYALSIRHQAPLRLSNCGRRRYHTERLRVSALRTTCLSQRCSYESAQCAKPAQWQRKYSTVDQICIAIADDYISEQAVSDLKPLSKDQSHVWRLGSAVAAMTPLFSRSQSAKWPHRSGCRIREEYCKLVKVQT